MEIENNIKNNNIDDSNIIYKRAIDILEKGDPLEFIMNTADEFHISDKYLKYIMHCSLICSSIKGSKGIQPYLSGEKGKGKTNLADTFKHLAPEDKVLKCTFSNKAIYYLIEKAEKELKKKIKGLTIYADDVDLSSDVEDLVKRATSDFNNRTVYVSVKDSEPKMFEIPAKTTWWFTSVEVSKSDQLADRFINISVDDSKETTQAVKNRQFEKASKSIENFEETENVKVCRKIYEIINSKCHEILFEDKHAKVFLSDNSRRTLPMLFDIVKCITATYFMQRKGISIDKDWDLGLQIWRNISNTNNLKLSNTEILINNLIPSNPGNITFEDLLKKLCEKGKCISKGTLSNIMKGYKHSRGYWIQGLVDKLSLNSEDVNGKLTYSRMME